MMASSNLNMLKTTGNNEHSDECYTPQEALLPLLPYLNTTTVYYDCTSGISGSIVEHLNENGFTCKSSEGRDFLTDTFSDFDCIITNPPYSKKDKFIEKCYNLNKPFALLLPVSALQGQRRARLFRNGIELLVLGKRIDFTGKGSPHFGVAWFCKDILPTQLVFA
jgi:hypothetical protein